MKLKMVIHEAEEGGYWAEVPALPGCVTQGESFEELLGNLYGNRRRLPFSRSPGHTCLRYQQSY